MLKRFLFINYRQLQIKQCRQQLHNLTLTFSRNVNVIYMVYITYLVQNMHFVSLTVSSTVVKEVSSILVSHYFHLSTPWLILVRMKSEIQTCSKLTRIVSVILPCSPFSPLVLFATTLTRLAASYSLVLTTPQLIHIRIKS